MGMNFPASPADGAYFLANGLSGPLYQYKSSPGGWRRYSGTASKFNKLVNPAMQISQSLGDNAVSVSALTYVMDQWVFAPAGGAVYSCSRVAKATPRGSKYRFRAAVTTAQAAPAAGDYNYFFQLMESWRVIDLNWGTNAAKWAIMRFGFCGPAGTYSASLRNASNLNKTFVWPFTVSAADANVDKEYVFVIPPCYDGTWNSTPNLDTLTFMVVVACGTTRQTSSWGQWLAGNFIAANTITANANTVGNTFELFDCGLYADFNATGVAPEFQAPDYIDALHDCLRYWQPIYAGRGHVVSATQAHLAIPYFVDMRVVPTCALIGTALRIYDGAAPNITSIGSPVSDARYFRATVTASAGGLTPGRACNILTDGQVANYIVASARM